MIPSAQRWLCRSREEIVDAWLTPFAKDYQSKKRRVKQTRSLHVANFDGPIQRCDRVVTFCRCVFVRKITCEIQVDNGLSYEFIVQFLCFIDVVAAGIAASMKVSDPPEVVADIAHDVSIHDLRMINVV